MKKLVTLFFSIFVLTVPFNVFAFKKGNIKKRNNVETTKKVTNKKQIIKDKEDELDKTLKSIATDVTKFPKDKVEKFLKKNSIKDEEGFDKCVNKILDYLIDYYKKQSEEAEKNKQENLIKILKEKLNLLNKVKNDKNFKGKVVKRLKSIVMKSPSLLFKFSKMM